MCVGTVSLGIEAYQDRIALKIIMDTSIYGSCD